MNIQFHSGQLQIFRDISRFRVAVMGRRFGKTLLLKHELLIAVMRFNLSYDPVSPPEVLGILPTLVQAKAILWKPLVSICQGELKAMNPLINRSDYTISFPNRPTIRICGANDKHGDGLRGKRIWFAGCDEYQGFNAGVLDNIIVPAMADTKGSRLLLTGTPKGTLNCLYKAFKTYSSHNLPTSTNPFVDKDEIARARQVLPPRIFRQEYEASFEAFEGQVYSELHESNQVPELPTEYNLVVMGIDWGDVHPAAVVVGLCQDTWYILEAYQGNYSSKSNRTIPQDTFEGHLTRLALKYNVSHAYCDPSRPSSILRTRQLEGLTNTVSGFNRIEEGLTQVGSLIYQNKLLMSTQISNAEDILYGQQIYEQLASYHRATDRDGNVTSGIQDGQEDHVCDALRYALATSKPIL